MKNAHSNTKDAVREWMDTFSMVGSMQGNDAALAREMDTIISVFTAENATPDIIDDTFRRIKMTSESRAWPTAAQVLTAMREVIRQKTGEKISSGGSRSSLGAFELDILDGKVLPTARRWLREYPGLRGHAISTLQYWGERLIDDRNREYRDNGHPK